jgi:DNA-binding NtrC family response regulator
MEKQKKNILIIDDDQSILHIFTRILQKQGYNTVTAETGQEAMEKLQERKCDLALVDMKLPDTNGTDLLGKLHASQPETVLIAITGFASLEDASKVIDRGAAAYLVKPVKSEDLIRIIADKLK